MIEKVQDALEAINQIRCEERALRFLVGRNAAERLGYTGRSREELLVLEDDEGLEVALYLDPGLLERLGRFEQGPAEAVIDHALEAFAPVTEGVSHFLYLNRSAELDRKVSLLELEVQAEIDKFATCVVACWKRGVGWATALLRRLFDHVGYIAGLGAPERWRYQEANRLARNFCQRLLRHVERGHLDRFLAELRYCYRLGAEAKLRHVGA